jgi:hypothetical protein
MRTPVRHCYHRCFCSSPDITLVQPCNGSIQFRRNGHHEDQATEQSIPPSISPADHFLEAGFSVNSPVEA